MKSASAELIALLASGAAHWQADAVTITLIDSTVLRWSTWDDTLTVDGDDFAAGVGALSRSKSRCVAGLEVDTMTLEIGVNLTALVLGIGAALAAQNGAFDGARVLVQRVFMQGAGTPTGTITVFEGAVSGVDITSSSIKLTAKSELEKLNVKLPRNLYQASCDAILYDAVCGLSKGAFTVTGTASGTPTTSAIPSGLSADDGFYNLGVLVMTSGAESGSRRGVRGYIGGTVYLSTPLSTAPVAGDTFSIYPGCDHASATCDEKFSNLLRYRGFPYVPKAEAAR